jgi:hypothetical protein
MWVFFVCVGRVSQLSVDVDTYTRYVDMTHIRVYRYMRIRVYGERLLSMHVESLRVSEEPAAEVEPAVEVYHTAVVNTLYRERIL